MKKLLLIGLALSTTAAMANEFEQLDSNKDGFLSKEEVANHARITAMFDKLDTNADGKLSSTELKAKKTVKQQ